MNAYSRELFQIHIGNTIHLQGVGSDPELQLLCNVVVSPQLQVSNKNPNVKGAGLWSKTLCLNQGVVEVQERSVPVLRKQSGCPGKHTTYRSPTSAQQCSGVETVAAVAALAATLSSPVLIFIALTLQFHS